MRQVSFLRGARINNACLDIIYLEGTEPNVGHTADLVAALRQYGVFQAVPNIVRANVASDQSLGQVLHRWP